MPQAKFQDQMSSDSGEEDFKGFYHIWAGRPSWSCDLDNLCKLWFPFPRRLHIQFDFDWPSGFREEDVCNCERTDDGRCILHRHVFIMKKGHYYGHYNDIFYSRHKVYNIDTCIAISQPPCFNDNNPLSARICLGTKLQYTSMTLSFSYSNVLKILSKM